MNINEQLLDLLLRRDLLLQRVSNGLSKEVALYYTELINQAINTIKDYDEITIVKMNKLIKEINSRIEFNYEEQLSNKFQELGVAEATYIPTAINGLIGVNIVDKLLPEPLIERIINNSILPDGHFINEAFTKLDDRLKDTFQSQIRLGVLNGSTNSEIVKGLKPILEDFTTNKVKTLSRTAVNTVTNNVRMEVYKENEDIFRGYEWQSILDSRVRYEHALLNTAMWDFNSKGLNEKGKKYKFRNAPDGWNCRCTLLPIIKTFKELGIDLEEVTGLTRSALNGEVPREITFNKWFESQDKKFQEEYLGIQRYQLFKDGKITLGNLINQDGKTLTIKELKQKYS